MTKGGKKMAEAKNIFGILRQNLRDAGCNELVIDNCIALASISGKKE